ncbi:YggS family pyridoxal phosphate-dependent enzyme [Mycolicibacterium sp. S2-37]|uniref:YggS family pyridoxal phosphate-dependent enzyme n=1 Tax=Mycolicibacterium sp. S2-37 TaxID=2810297 RepID=UPI001A945035|nr:YggS family pyridoxal phosphate-dependent enzyme [Mycolicibacterium sp. S2-37]MBO0680559.1 YggS family pyridoxal phosphate-dependent enzyme [Mycolicibacterium sp. S2-37]
MSSPRDTELAGALAEVRSRLARAAAAAGRDAGEITLLPVTKFFPASDVLALYALGCRDFGESREQEASAKVAEVASALTGDDPAEEAVEPIRWHMLGRIQRNKARAVARWAYSAHSVDSVKVVAALDRGAGVALEEAVRTAPLRVYVQLSLDGDTERGGVPVDRPDLVDELCAAVDGSAALDFVGLMAIPPLGADPHAAFARLRQESDRVQRNHSRRLELSAGMSGDLEAAVQHGSTCVRVGTALMGQRPLASP